MVIARYGEGKQYFFNKYMSPRNKLYCETHGYEYVEITHDDDIELFRNNPTWWKFTITRDMINNGTLKEGDTLVHIDADMCIVDITKDLATNKSYSYSIDNGNTHCMGLYSIKVNDWSVQLIDSILDEHRYQSLKDVKTDHVVGGMSSFWGQFREQASWYSLAGIKRHSWKSFWELPDFGWHSDKNGWTKYSLEELYENVEILPTQYNVTLLDGEFSTRFNIVKSKKEEVIVRHFAAGQRWMHEWFIQSPRETEFSGPGTKNKTLLIK